MTELPQKAQDAIERAEDPIKEFDRASGALLLNITSIPIDPEKDKGGVVSMQKHNAYTELSDRLEKIRKAAIEARSDPTPPKLKQLYLHMVPFLKRTENMEAAKKHAPRVRRAVRQMLGMGWFEKAKKEFEESGEKLENVPPDHDLPE